MLVRSFFFKCPKCENMFVVYNKKISTHFTEFLYNLFFNFALSIKKIYKTKIK